MTTRDAAVDAALRAAPVANPHAMLAQALDRLRTNQESEWPRSLRPKEGRSPCSDRADKHARTTWPGGSLACCTCCDDTWIVLDAVRMR